MAGGLDVIAAWREGTASARPALQEAQGEPPVAAEGEVFSRLRSLIAGKIKLDPESKISAMDTPQSLGMDSVSLIEFKHSLDGSFGRDCSLDDLLEAPTLLELSRKLALSLPQSGDFRLTPAQESLWLYEQLGTAAPLYNIAAAWALQGDLDPAALRQGIEELLRRHEALRTGFRSSDGLAQRALLSPKPVLGTGTRKTLAGLGIEAARAECSERIRLEALKRFDLEAPPLFRARLYSIMRTSPTSCCWWWHHPAVADGWSFKVLWDEPERALRCGAPTGASQQN